MTTAGTVPASGTRFAFPRRSRATQPPAMAIYRRILIADDDAEVRLGAAELLDPLGLQVLLAESGAQALDIFRSRRPIHLALLDVHMPDRGGLELFGALRDVVPDLPCILWSGDVSEGFERSALRAGVSAFLHKPVPPAALRGVVQRVLADHWGDTN